MFDILGVIQLHMFYVYNLMCWVWTLKHIIDQIFLLSVSSEENACLIFLLSVSSKEHGYLIIVSSMRSEEHEYLMFLLSEKLWRT